MLRRKNNQFEYVQARNDQSPYRFQRNNLNLSPGVSPMRCRTPTRNISPLTISNINNNNNQRTHSPIKLVNPMINGFYRNQMTNQQQNIHSKYITINDQIKRQLQYIPQENSRLKYIQATEKIINHDKTKLFSNLVSKLNSSKRKQPELFKKYIKNQHTQQNNKQKQKYIQTNFIKKKTHQQQQHKVIQNHIQPVQNLINQQQNINECYYNSNNQRMEDKRLASTSSAKNIKKKIFKPILDQQLLRKIEQKIQIKNKGQIKREIVNVNQQQFDDYDDIRIYLDKVKQSKTVYLKQSFKKLDVKDSLMNMDPYI